MREVALKVYALPSAILPRQTDPTETSISVELIKFVTTPFCLCVTESCMSLRNQNEARLVLVSILKTFVAVSVKILVY